MATAPTQPPEHDPTADLHVFVFLAGGGLVHPHNRRGWEWLLGRLGAAVMQRYQTEALYNPEVGAIEVLVSEAELDGLVVQAIQERPKEP